MKVAINCSYYIPQGGGIKEYIYNLLNNLSKIDNKNEYIIYVSKDNFVYAKETLPTAFRIKKTPFSSINPIQRSVFENNFYLQEEGIEDFNIFHSPFFHSPELKKAKIIITVHDLRLYRYPQTYAILRYFFLKNKVKKSVKNADRIIAISNFTKEELVNLCDADQNKISVIHEAIDLDFFNEKNIVNYTPNLPFDISSSKFVLAVGHIEPRKNYNNLIRAFSNINDKNVKLVIAGKKGHGYKEFFHLMEQNKNIYYLDFADSKLLLWLYKNASFLIFPSFYEGFGFPPLEAAALNTVSAVSKASCIPEICGDSSFYFDPFDIVDIVNVLNNLLESEDKLVGKKMKLRMNLDRYSWEKNARETLKLYQAL